MCAPAVIIYASVCCLGFQTQSVCAPAVIIYASVRCLGFQTQSVCAQAVGPSICGTDNCQAGALCQQVSSSPVFNARNGFEYRSGASSHSAV